MVMEELLNKLLEKGWKPFGVEAKKIYIDKNEITIERLNGFRVVYTTRQISSIDSGLWQFVCGNGMVALKLSARMKNPRIDFEDVDDYNNGHIVMNYKQKCEGDKAEYRLIESALCKEEDLEQFLIDNIKV